MTRLEDVGKLQAAKIAAGVDGAPERAKAQARLLEIIGILEGELVGEGLIEKLEFTSSGQIVSRGGLGGLSEEGSKMINRLVGELMKLVNHGAEIPPQYVISAEELDRIANRDLSNR